MFRSIISVILATLITVGIPADQAAWNNRKDSVAAAGRLLESGRIRMYCAPCGDAGYTEYEISSVLIRAAGTEGNQYTISINEETEIDLAYVYIPVGPVYRNLAMMMKIQVSDVPAVLPAGLKPADEIGSDPGDNPGDYE